MPGQEVAEHEVVGQVAGRDGRAVGDVGEFVRDGAGEPGEYDVFGAGREQTACQWRRDARDVADDERGAARGPRGAGRGDRSRDQAAAEGSGAANGHLVVGAGGGQQDGQLLPGPGVGRAPGGQVRQSAPQGGQFEGGDPAQAPDLGLGGGRRFVGGHRHGALGDGPEPGPGTRVGGGLGEGESGGGPERDGRVVGVVVLGEGEQGQNAGQWLGTRAVGGLGEPGTQQRPVDTGRADGERLHDGPPAGQALPGDIGDGGPGRPFGQDEQPTPGQPGGGLVGVQGLPLDAVGERVAL